MGGLFSKSPSKTPEEEATEGAELERQPVNLGDTVQIKRIIDDLSCQVIMESDYPEDCRIGNHKIALGIVTCFFALVAQLYPKTYPHCTWVQLISVLAYFAANLALQMFTTYCEKDIVMFTKAKPGAAASSAGIALSTCLPRFSDKYTLRISSWTDTDKSLASKPSVTLEKSVSEWFYEDGHLAEDILRKDVGAALKKFESAQSSKDR